MRKETKNSVQPIGQLIAYSGRHCQEDDNAYNDCTRLRERQAAKDSCLLSPELPRLSFIFETNDLNTSNQVNAEFLFESCGLGRAGNYGKDTDTVVRVGLSSTPSIISFSGAGADSMVFNIDRKNLEAGYGANRFFQCELKDVDTSQNAI